MPKIHIITPKTKMTTSEIIVNKQGVLTIGAEVAHKLNIRADDYVLIGQAGGIPFIVKKPEGFFGYKVSKPTNGVNLVVSAKAVLKEGVSPGVYTLSTTQFPEDEETATGKKIRVHWYKMEIKVA